MIDGIQKYAKETFPGRDVISEKEIEQLTWSVRSSPTPEKDFFNVPANNAFIEVRRALSRLYCLDLLIQGENTYELFTAPQTNLEIFKSKLSFEQYQILCQKFAALDQLKVEALRVSTVISSVPLSPQARTNADKVMGKDQYTIDSVEFLADTFDDIEKAKQIYPLVAQLFERHPDEAEQAKLAKYLKAAFCHRQHYRHMLYTEGNENMFRALLDSVANGTQDKESFDFWVCHWTINITGFRGQINPKGSLYLTDSTFWGMQAIEQSLRGAFSIPPAQAKEILNQYLDVRAEMLELPNDITENERRLLAHIASMMRLYSPEEGEMLKGSFKMISEELRNHLVNVYFNCDDPTEPTPTFAPAMFENTLDWAKNTFNFGMRTERFVRNLGILNAIVNVGPFYLKSLEEYREKRKAGTIPAKQPLTFRDAASADQIKLLCLHSAVNTAFNILDFSVPTIDNMGTVKVVQPQPAKTLLPAFESIKSQQVVTSSAEVRDEKKLGLHS